MTVVFRPVPSRPDPSIPERRPRPRRWWLRRSPRTPKETP